MSEDEGGLYTDALVISEQDDAEYHLKAAQTFLRDAVPGSDDWVMARKHTEHALDLLEDAE